MSQVTIEYMISCENGYFVFTRKAPQLPTGVTWHAGAEFSDGWAEFPIESVQINEDGSVIVKTVIDKSESTTESYCRRDIETLIRYGWELTDEG